MKRLLLFLSAALPAVSSLVHAMLPPQCTQAIIGIAEGWNSSRVTLSLVEKAANGSWQRVLGPIPARLGRNGLVWGLGLHANGRGVTVKREGDGRSPAGIFSIGGLWITNPTPVRHSRNMPEVKVGPCDLWVSDPNTPGLYNRHVRLKHPATSEWEKKEQMRQTDYAHSIKLLIGHNTPDVKGCPIVGAGSSIFFHIWRNNGTAPTAGCTAMAEQNLRAIIARLEPKRTPVYILLPRVEYAKLRTPWRLP